MPKKPTVDEIIVRKGLPEEGEEDRATLLDMFDDPRVPSVYRPLIARTMKFMDSVGPRLKKHKGPLWHKLKNPEYKARTAVHKAACVLNKEHPNWTCRKIAEGPEIMAIMEKHGWPISDEKEGAEYEAKAFNTAYDWVRQIVKRPRGRPSSQ